MFSIWMWSLLHQQTTQSSGHFRKFGTKMTWTRFSCFLIPKKFSFTFLFGQKNAMGAFWLASVIRRFLIGCQEECSLEPKSGLGERQLPDFVWSTNCRTMWLNYQSKLGELQLVIPSGYRRTKKKILTKNRFMDLEVIYQLSHKFECKHKLNLKLKLENKHKFKLNTVKHKFIQKHNLKNRLKLKTWKKNMGLGTWMWILLLADSKAVWMGVCMSLSVCACMCMSINTCMHVCVCMCMCMHVSM